MQEGQFPYSHQKKWQHGKGKNKIKKSHFFQNANVFKEDLSRAPFHRSLQEAFRRWHGHPATLPSLQSFICGLRRTKAVPHGRRDRAGPDCKRFNQCLPQNVSGDFLPTDSHIWVQHGICAGAIKSRKITGQQGRAAGLNRSLQQSHTLRAEK